MERKKGRGWRGGEVERWGRWRGEEADSEVLGDGAFGDWVDWGMGKSWLASEAGEGQSKANQGRSRWWRWRRATERRTGEMEERERVREEEEREKTSDVKKVTAGSESADPGRINLSSATYVGRPTTSMARRAWHGQLGARGLLHWGSRRGSRAGPVPQCARRTAGQSTQRLMDGRQP